MKAKEIKQLFLDLDDLYLWMDSIYSVKCVSKCNKCCEQDIIWMLMPELVRINSITKPKKVEFGCPYRTKTGCSIYEYRPLVCRSYGALQLKEVKEINMLRVVLPDRIQSLAGPGYCDEKIKESTCNVEELNNIYACYNALAQTWGLTAIGSCRDLSLQASQTQIMSEMQKNISSYNVYSANGVLNMHTRLQDIFTHVFVK
jgi:Fe-S-cluster containining protein